MKRKAAVFLITLVLLVSFAITSTAETNIVDSIDFQGDEIQLTLDQVMEIVMKDNLTIKQSKLALEQAEVTKDEYEATARATRRGAKNNQDRNENSMTYLEGIKLPLLKGDYAVANAERNLQATTENIKATVEKSYFELLQAEEANNINKENLDIAEELYEQTKQKFELGLVSKQEVLDSELSLKQAENSYNSSQNSLKKGRIAFNVVLGYDVMANTKLADKLEGKEYEERDIYEAISKALSNRNAIKAAEYADEVEQLNMEITSKRYTENTYSYKKQVVVVEQASKKLEDAKNNIQVEVISNYLDIKEKYDEIKAGEKSVELAKEVLKLNQLSYEVGMETLTTVQEAQTSLLKARLELSKSILDYNLAISEFEDSIGIGRDTM